MWITLPSLRILLYVFIIVGHSIVDAFTTTLSSSSSSRPPSVKRTTTTYLQRHDEVPSPQPSSPPTTRIVILGGTGRIGTAVAIHLLQRDETCEVVLVGRRPRPKAIEEVIQESSESSSSSSTIRQRVSFQSLSTVWEASPELETLVNNTDCLIHVAGPYLDQKPIPLDMAIQSPRCKVYVDVSDPLPYLETSLLKKEEAQRSNLTALVAAGAFPGLSNVLAQEAASVAVSSGGNNPKSQRRRVQDVRFHYFTAGLGGSGTINLYITNLGFGEPMVQYDQGHLRFFPTLSGKLLGHVDFFLPPQAVKESMKKRDNDENDENDDGGNQRAQERVGRRTVFAWPFPEAATVATHLRARGHSYAAMGTAPNLWNTMLGLLVEWIPRSWWSLERFSKGLADFSFPMVWMSDKWLEWTGVGETHAMRVDVTFVPEGRRRDNKTPMGVSIVQAHDSFRTCVGQSCAEFALDLLHGQKPPRPGVYVPEQFYEEDGDRRRILDKLTSTSGTFCYTGPVVLLQDDDEGVPPLPTGWVQAMTRAKDQEDGRTSMTWS